MPPSFLINVFIILLLHSCTTVIRVQSLPKFSSILTFGDSTVDTGNNNFLATLAKGNHLPYGQDFPGKVSTGRFSNGKLIPDFVANALGIKATVPPFLDPNLSSDELRTGVNFASSGSGYDDLTVAATGVIPVSKQTDYFKDYLGKLRGTVGEKAANDIISRALVIISAGTNDFVLNYYSLPIRRKHYTVSSYQDFLQNNLQSFVKELYNLGCRNIIVAGLPPMGCLPIQITTRFKDPRQRTCLEDQNSDSRSYNQKLTNLVPKLQASLPGIRVAYVDVYTPLMDMINNPKKYGFTETNRGCCGTGFIEAAALCNPLTPMCATPSQFLFWDCIHPSQSAYQSLADYLVKKLSSSFAA